ncbi:proline--tRNA ligase [Candidatus Acetothermia bacterium]|nr:proline--tRNA ligase [Candidatus Acetothermia bacterium]
MKWSLALIPTLREEPKDAELMSHKLLLRAGLARPLAAGIYTLLPLGQRVRLKIENIIREEMNAISGQEILMPVVQPAELWQESGRWDQYDELLVRFQDRSERSMVIAPTHEEAVTDLVRRHVSSYRQLPLVLYQIQTKFRDEPRSRGGLIRVREFTMKDAYSFHTGFEDLDMFYPKIQKAYLKIFERCGLDVLTVGADPGLIGGKDSHEFSLPNNSGEDQVVLCDHCNYAANMECAQALKEIANRDESLLSFEPLETPNCTTIESLANFLKVPTSKTAKAVFYTACHHDHQELIFVVIHGDLEVNENKLARVVGTADLRAATDEEIKAVGAVPGYASPVGLTQKVKVIVDDLIPHERNLVAGANREHFHLKNVNYGRDFHADIVADIATVREGDRCTRCQQGILKIKRAIELGHTFKLGTRYSSAMRAMYLDTSGQEQPIVMGCYGIGVGRLMAAIIEAHHDAKGIVWPGGVAPFEATVLVLNSEDSAQRELGEQVYQALRQAQMEVLFDDRPESAGVKFKDADLIGIPLQIVIGPRGLKNKTAELQRRRDGSKREVSYTEGFQAVVQAVTEETTIS